MNLEEKIKLIEEKIANLPSEFDVEERHIIDNNPRLIELIHQTLLNNPHLFNEEVFGCFTDTVLNSIIEEHGNTAYYHYIDNMLKTSIPSIIHLNQYLEQTNLTEEQKEHFRNIVTQSFQDKELTIERFDISDESIKEMLKYNRFDLISQIKDAYLEEHLLDVLWDSYPFDKYPFPRFFAKNSYLPSKYIDSFPLEESIIAYVKLVSNTTFGSDEERKKACSLLPIYIKSLKERLNTINELDLTFLYDDTNFFPDLIPGARVTDVISNETKESMLQIAVKLFKLGLYDISDDLISKNLITKEELKSVIVELAIKGDAKRFENIRFVNFCDHFKEDLGLATTLLENGFIQEAQFISFDFVSSKEDYIIEQLKQKNPKFKEFAKRLNYDGKGLSDKQFDIYLAMLASGFVEEISTGTFNTFTDEEINELKYILVKYSNIKFLPANMNNNDFLKILDTLIETKRDDSIIDFIISSYHPETIDILKEINKKDTLSRIISTNFTKGNELLQKHLKSIIEVPELLDEYYKNDVYIERIIELVNHNEDLESFYSIENYNKIKHYLSKHYNLPLESLERLQNQLGPLIIRFIENENIQALIKLSVEEQEKILALFPKEEFTLQDLNGVYDSLKQYEFSKKNSSQVQIFPTLLHAIEDQNEELVESLITEVSNELDKNFLKRFLKKYDLPNEFNENNIIDLVRFVINKIKTSNGEKLEKYHTILHEMTDYYISKKREEYRHTYNMEEELQLPYTFDEKSLENVMTRYIIMESPNIQTRFYRNNPDSDKTEPTVTFGSEVRFNLQDRAYVNDYYYNLAEHIIMKMMEKGVDEQLAKETFIYYIKKDKTACTDFKQVQKTIPILIKTTKEILDDIPDLHRLNRYGISSTLINRIISHADSNKEIKRIYQVNSSKSLFDTLTQLNILAMQKGVLNNPEVYNSLLQTMEKRKLHLLPQELSNILGTQYINISPDLTNVAGFISYYGAIYDNVKSNLAATGKSSDNILLNITTILIYAEVYSGISSVYSQILGSEDAKLIKANPGPNAATKKIANEGRLKEAVERTKKLYERNEITIPPFEQDVPVSDNKNMHVVVGNFTHPSNLTHGERTGACMRIGGVGESLFEFALDNPNGFHIRFEDPKTHEYISRVTGFRNGNTVFLNELRDSCNKNKYNNEEVINACTKVGEILIELSKNSSCPIDNVVVHRAHATINMDSPMEYLGVESIKEGLPQFYSDVSTSAIILATTAKQGKFTPLNFDKNDVPTYQPLREKPRVAKNIQEASNKINRVNSVKRLLAGENYEYIEPMQFPNGLIYAIVSDDWYIYVDENGIIFKDIIDLDPRAKEEFAEALIEVENNLAQIKADNQEVKHGL